MVLGATYANVPEVGTEMNSNSNSNSNNKTTNNNMDEEKEDLDREDPAYEVADNGIPTYAVPRKVSAPKAPPRNATLINILDEEKIEMQERSALINNKDGTAKDDNDEEDKVMDRESEFANLIADGDADKLESFLEHHLGDEAFILGSLATEKVGQKLKDLNIVEYPPLLTAIDLSILCQKESSLEVLLEHCSTYYPTFPHYVRCRSFINQGLVLEKLAAAALKNSYLTAEENSCLKTTEEMLNIRLDTNHDDDDGNLLKGNLELRMDLSVFHRSDRSPRHRETLALLPMIQDEEKTLAKHPVCQTFISVKWQKLKIPFYLTIVYMITLACAATISYIIGIFKWITLIMTLPLVLTTILHTFAKTGIFISLLGLRKTKVSLPCPTFRGVLRTMLIVSAICNTFSSTMNTMNVFQVLLVLSAWLEAFFAVGRIPKLAIFYQTLLITLEAIVKLALTMACLTLALVFTLHVLSGENEKWNPLAETYAAYLQTRSLFLASRVPNDLIYAKLPLVVTLLVILLVFLISTIGITNSTIGKLYQNKKDLEAAQKVSELDKTEALINFARYLTKFIKGIPDISKYISVSYTEDDGIFRAFPERRSERKTLKRQFDLLQATGDTTSEQAAKYQVPMSVWGDAKIIAEELHDQIRSRRVRQYAQRDLGDYTSLYFNPGESCTSENEYEIVGEQEDGADGNNKTNNNRFSSFFGMRESLLRELRRDLTRIMSGSSSNGDASGKDSHQKSVNVRPGLALGVIALQAGARGPRIVLQ